ncbi:hypothetical protein E1269_23915 [Jiangella asiatica]|uniref:DUF4287 domain-containing protein n=2 Tax=Jiangella asiatica TaxID=2530372 RepID=A0A4R5CRK9_9ACTN|nr:hypothetical protein E1269_23915 [Jiangella asiatica]
MAKTGESYTAARATLLAGRLAPTRDAEEPVLTAPDAIIRERTGRGWEEWFDLLDDWGAAGRPHREIARHVAELLDVVPLAWPAQAVTVSYERARGGRAVGQHPNGFAVTASRTVDVDVERLFDACADEPRRAGWLPGRVLRERTATRPRSARFDWIGVDGLAPGQGRVAVTFVPKGEAKALVAIEHSRLPDREAAALLKAWWRERLGALKARLEDGNPDA